MVASELLLQAKNRVEKRNALFAMIPELKKSSDPGVIALIEAWENEFKETV